MARCLNGDYHIEGIDDSRYNENTHCHIISHTIEEIPLLDDIQTDKGRANVEGFGVHCVETRSSHLPSAEILRLFHETFPDVCLSEDDVDCSTPFSEREHGSVGILDEECQQGPETIWQAFGRYSHESYTVPETVHYGTYHNPSMRVPCSWTIEDDPSFWEEIEELNSMPQCLLSWTFGDCAPAA